MRYLSGLRQVGLKGEELEIYKEENLGSAIWSELEPTAGQPLTWYQVITVSLSFFLI